MELSSGKNIRLFKNPILERLTYVHPLVPISIWGPVAVGLVFYSFVFDLVSFSSVFFIVVSGLFFWTFAEYFLHRFVFHYKPTTSIGKKIAYLIHEVHHDDPNDARRLLMPPSAAVILAVIFYSLFLFVFGRVYTKPFFAGFLVGYLCYDYIHLSTHFSKTNSKTLKWLKKYHMLHHFSTPNLRYGVSNPLWDIVFNTMPERFKVKPAIRPRERSENNISAELN